MHHVILGISPSEEVDHINRDGLDNRIENFRLCNSLHNSYNKGKRKDNKSGYIGVGFRKGKLPWVAVLSANKKRLYRERFKTIEEATYARDLAAVKYHGEFAVLNFPERVEEYRKELEAK